MRALTDEEVKECLNLSRRLPPSFKERFEINPKTGIFVYSRELCEARNEYSKMSAFVFRQLKLEVLRMVYKDPNYCSRKKKKFEEKEKKFSYSGNVLKEYAVAFFDFDSIRKKRSKTQTNEESKKIQQAYSSLRKDLKIRRNQIIQQQITTTEKKYKNDTVTILLICVVILMISYSLNVF